MCAENIRRWRCGEFVFFLNRPLIMGIVNATPDSFSDGGCFAAAADAIAHGRKMLEDGADILDVGGESTRPNAIPVDAETEKRRILPVIESLAKEGAAISADTMKPAVMRGALESGACILNDVCGFSSADSRAVAADSDCGVVVMHMKGDPQTMQNAPVYEDVCAEVAAFLHNRADELQSAGIAAERICIDPGIGFGKTAAHNLQLMRGLSRLDEKYPLLLGASRKSWLRAMCGEDMQMRDIAGAAAAAILASRGAAILRVHNVAATRVALQIAAALE